MVFRKLLASSSFAIAETLHRLATRLTEAKQELGGELRVAEELQNEYETISEEEEEWLAEDFENESQPQTTPAHEKAFTIDRELKEIQQYHKLASGIKQNAKGDALLIALRKGFAELTKLGASQKAVIFTESKRTQAYLRDLLATNGYAGQIVTINGTNDDEFSHNIYAQWLLDKTNSEETRLSRSAEMRAALVEHFRNLASILLATEAGAEGLNLQFASLVVNFDLPWNPQRVEQRIGRCHRYGQKHDVVVINFINRKNAADVRVFELLSQKFRLFEGLFGASDDVLGALESGVDFEKRVADIYQGCRTETEINQAFNELQQELEVEITARFDDTRKKLLEHFDEEVHERLRINREQTLRQVSKMEDWLWQLTIHELSSHAIFENASYKFALHSVPSGLNDDGVNIGTYLLARKESTNGKGNYRLGHPLAKWLVDRAKERSLEQSELSFDYTKHPTLITPIANLVGESGVLSVRKLTISGLETEDHLLCIALKDNGACLDEDTCGRLLMLNGTVLNKITITADERVRLSTEGERQRAAVVDAVKHRHRQMFEREVDKLDGWAEDLKASLEIQLAELDTEIRNSKKQSHLAVDLEEKLTLRRAANDLEKQRNRKRKELFTAQDDIEKRKDQFIAIMEKRLTESIIEEELFTIRWRVV